MKYELLLVAVVAGVAACDATITPPESPAWDVTTAAVDCLVPPEGLVSWWPGDGHFNDIVGLNNPYEVAGATFDAGVVGQGFRFTGAPAEHIYISDAPSLRVQEFTIELWATKTGLGANEDHYGPLLVVKSADPQPFSQRPASWGIWWKGAFDKKISATVIFAEDTPHYGNPPIRLVSSSDFPYPNTVHVALTFDGMYAKLYVDGNLEAEYTEGPRTVNQGPGDLILGASAEWAAHVGYPRTHNGIIDEVGLFDRALTQAEIRAIHDAGPAGKAIAPAQALELMTTQVVTLELQRGLENALSATLNAAANSILNDRPSALKQLAAFNNLVDGLRGSQLSESEADALIARSQQITRAVSNCS